MTPLKFFPLKIKDIRTETDDCISVAFNIPNHFADVFKFLPGQYLTLRCHIGNEDVRRSYSICSGAKENELRVAIKMVHQGKFSTYAHNNFKVGDMVDVMPPMGKFTPHAAGDTAKEYLAFAAGSGITPIMSIMKTVLESEPLSCFTLIYGNKDRNSVIFREDIEGLKNLYMQRFRVFFVMSRETMDIPLLNGRINGEKCGDFCKSVVDVKAVDEAFICGPESMILSVREQLLHLGMHTDQVHIELFSSPDQPKATHEKWVSAHKDDQQKMSKVTIRLDGITTEIDMPYSGISILDAAMKKGADLPFACKGGVCCTCRAKVMEGKVDMEVNYALEPDEVERGYILTCQAHPRSEKVVVDFDER